MNPSSLYQSLGKSANSQQTAFTYKAKAKALIKTIKNQRKLSAQKILDRLEYETHIAAYATHKTRIAREICCVKLRLVSIYQIIVPMPEGANA